MTQKEKLKTAQTALDSLQRNLSALSVLLQRGRLATVIDLLEHMQRRCAEISEQIKS
jgi:hypothetical protein